MSKGKKPPERSKIERAKPLAYQRRASDDAGVVSDPKPIEVKAPAVEKAEERTTGEMPAVKPSEADAPKVPEAKASPAPTPEPPKSEAKPAPKTEAKPEPETKPAPKAEAKPEPEAKPAPKAEAKPEPKAEAKPEPEAAKPEPKVEAKPEKEPEAKSEPERASRETITMPVAVAVGAPPAVPGDVENPTFMPAPADVPSGSPTDPAQAPGLVPSGDSRSLRRGADFALIYRQGSAVITRFGVVGQRGQWRVVEYPTPTSASNAYAKECSRFVGEGFSDYRD